MASTKLADTFKAHRVSICVVNFCHLMTAANRCIELGLQPIFSGKGRSGVFINVVVPFRENELNRLDSAMDILRENLSDLSVRFDGKPVEVELVCPPNDFIPKAGVCSRCSKLQAVTTVDNTLVVSKHNCTVTGITGICPGSGEKPVACLGPENM